MAHIFRSHLSFFVRPFSEHQLGPAFAWGQAAAIRAPFQKHLKSLPCRCQGIAMNGAKYCATDYEIHHKLGSRTRPRFPHAHVPAGRGARRARGGRAKGGVRDLRAPAAAAGSYGGNIKIMTNPDFQQQNMKK